VIVAVFGGTLGWLVGHVAYRNGTSSTVTSRLYGLGTRGSVLASLIYSFMIIGFLALEDALLYYGTLFMFGWAPSVANAIVIYGLLTVVWIALTTFGLPLVQRTSTVLLIAFVVLTVGLAGLAVARSGLSVGEILANALGLLMIAGDILGLINRYLGILAVTTTALAGVIIADYYIVRRRRAANPDLVESVNWAGVLSVVLSAATGGFLAEAGITPLGFLVTLAMVLVLYPVLRRSVLRGPREDAAEPGRLASR